MKRNTLVYLSALSGIAMLLASCSSVKQNTAFNERKYTNFRHRDPVVVFNHPAQVNEKRLVTAEATRQNTNVTTVISEKPVTASTAAATHKTERATTPALPPNPAVVASNSNNVKNATPLSPNENMSYAPAPVNEMAPTKTTDGGGSSIDPLLLVIIAILLAPLAVFLYDNKASTRFWIDLILWLIGIGAFGLIYLGILWLVAVIYAVLIVLGKA